MLFELLSRIKLIFFSLSVAHHFSDKLLLKLDLLFVAQFLCMFVIRYHVALLVLLERIEIRHRQDILV